MYTSAWLFFLVILYNLLTFLFANTAQFFFVLFAWKRVRQYFIYHRGYMLHMSSCLSGHWENKCAFMDVERMKIINFMIAFDWNWLDWYFFSFTLCGVNSNWYLKYDQEPHRKESFRKWIFKKTRFCHVKCQKWNFILVHLRPLRTEIYDQNSFTTSQSDVDHAVYSSLIIVIMVFFLGLNGLTVWHFFETL